MAWVAVDKDCTECVYFTNPFRNKYLECWEVFVTECIELPKGSIKKLIGRELTWEDEPVELKEEGE